MSHINNALMPVAVRGGQPTDVSSSSKCQAVTSSSNPQGRCTMLIGDRSVSHLESPYDVTAEDWHAHWHDEDEGSSAPSLSRPCMYAALLTIPVERAKRLNRHNWYPKQEDVSGIGYWGIQKVNIEYATADHERLNRHRVPFANQNPKKV